MPPLTITTAMMHDIVPLFCKVMVMVMHTKICKGLIKELLLVNYYLVSYMWLVRRSSLGAPMNEFT